MADIGIVLPTYNEEGNIAQLIDKIFSALTPKYVVEIIVVDDDSSDKTRAVVGDTFANDNRVRLIHRKDAPGLAASIRDGLRACRAQRVVVMDADLTHDPDEILQMLHVGQVFDIVSGSRFCEGGSMASRRHYMASLIYNWLLRVILQTQVQDNLGGFWTMERANLSRLPTDRIFIGYGDYFFRLLRYAELKGMTIVELPATYRARTAGESKSRFSSMLFSYSKAAWSLRRELRNFSA